MGEWKSYADESRLDWGTEQDGNLNRDQINTGCLIRIAYAMEAMAQRHIELLQENERLSEQVMRFIHRYEKAERSRAALQGWVTRLKEAKRDEKA